MKDVLLIAYMVGLFVVLLLAVAYVVRFTYRFFKGERIVIGNREEAVKQRKESVSMGKAVGIAFLVVVFVVAFSTLWPQYDYELTASQLDAEFNKNELAAFSKYDGKVVRVSGEFVSSGVSFGEPYLSLGILTWMRCYLDESSVEKAARLKVGDSVEVEGRVNGKIGSVFLENCHL